MHPSFAACLLLSIAACGGDATSGEAGDATAADVGDVTTIDVDADVGADCGPTFQCCYACDDDTPSLAECVDGKRVCPAGLKPASELVCPCYSMKCVTPPYHASCVACDGGTAPSTCDVDANVFVCPPGMHEVDALDASCD